MPSDANHKKSEFLWNVFTILILLAILVVAAAVLVIFINPASGLNPFPPPTLPELASLPTASSGSSAAATATMATAPAATQPITASATAAVVVMTPTTSILPTAQPSEAPETPDLDEFVAIEEGLPLPASEYDPARGCDWMGVAGQVYDIQGLPIKGIRVLVRAVLDGSPIELIGMSGTALIYGESGYEVKLADWPVASSGQATIQLIDQAGLPLSGAYPFDTYDNCDENLILIDFQEIR